MRRGINVKEDENEGKEKEEEEREGEEEEPRKIEHGALRWGRERN